MQRSSKRSNTDDDVNKLNSSLKYGAIKIR